MAPGLVESWLSVVELSAADLRGWGLAYARVAPTITLVPAFGMRAVPGPARILLGLTLGLSIAPALAPLEGSGVPWPALMLWQVALGLPVAIVAATGIWVLVMVGGLVDELGGSRAELQSPILERPIGPVGMLLGLLGCLLFLESGGPARVAAALMQEQSVNLTTPALRAVLHLTGGIRLAVALAALLLAASLVLQLASALITRAASPAHLSPALEPLRSLSLIVLIALLLDRILVASTSALMALGGA